MGAPPLVETLSAADSLRAVEEAVVSRGVAAARAAFVEGGKVGDCGICGSNAKGVLARFFQLIIRGLTQKVEK